MLSWASRTPGTGSTAQSTCAARIRAAVNDIEHKPVQGGSTIAQQYVKNVLLLEAELIE